MCAVLRSLLLAACLAAAALADTDNQYFVYDGGAAADCVIDLECRECVPDNLPIVTSHRAKNGTITASNGDEVVLSCSGGKFLLYPLQESLSAACEAGRFRVRRDNALRHLLELGCQENVFEDTLHQVNDCAPPLQGRAYVLQDPAAQGMRHLATLCFDADRAVAVRATAGGNRGLAMPPHAEARAPLSLLGNFNHMFDARTRNDAEHLYGDDASLNKRLHELLRHERFRSAGQTLTAGKLLSPDYFDDQCARVSDFASNKVAVWGSVAHGNLRSLQSDVSRARRARPGLLIHAGTRLVSRVRTTRGHTELHLKPGGRFPVPRYVWTVVHDPASRRAAALVLLNEPFLAVSEVRGAVFCESACARMSWLRELRRARAYETPLYGLVFCCNIHDFAAVVPEMPAGAFRDVPRGDDGLLTDLVG